MAEKFTAEEVMQETAKAYKLGYADALTLIERTCVATRKQVVSSKLSFECEDCFGSFAESHKCQCEAYGASAPGKPGTN